MKNSIKFLAGLSYLFTLTLVAANDNIDPKSVEQSMIDSTVIILSDAAEVGSVLYMRDPQNDEYDGRLLKVLRLNPEKTSAEIRLSIWKHYPENKDGFVIRHTNNDYYNEPEWMSVEDLSKKRISRDSPNIIRNHY